MLALGNIVAHEVKHVQSACKSACLAIRATNPKVADAGQLLRVAVRALPRWAGKLHAIQAGGTQGLTWHSGPRSPKWQM